MQLTGLKKDNPIQSLDDIFANDDLGLLLNVKPVQKRTTIDEQLLIKFQEVEQFFKQHNRLPEKEGNFEEKQLYRSWAALLNNAEFIDAIEPFDAFGLMATTINKNSKPNSVKPIQSLDDILADDDFGLLNIGNTDIFKIEHIPAQLASKPYSDEYNAVRTVCQDFWRYEALFKSIHEALKQDKAHLERLKTETHLQIGDVFLIQGMLCYIAEEIEIEQRKSERATKRFRVIYENGMESNMISRSLARAVYKAEDGKKVILNYLEDFQLLANNQQQDLITGMLYIVKLVHPKQELSNFKNLYKIGYTTSTVESRISDCINDIAFLESEVQPVLTFQCININPHTLERLMHAFFAARKLNIKLISKDGKTYIPHEWFDVPLSSIEKAAYLIKEGKINQYRLNNTTGEVVLKENS